MTLSCPWIVYQPYSQHGSCGFLCSYRTFFILILLSMVQPDAVSADTITVAVRAHSGVEMAVQRWQPTVDYLQQILPEYDFQLLPVEGIKEMEEQVEANSVDFVITQPVAYVDLERYFQASRVLTLETKFGTSFGSVIFCRRDSGIHYLQDLQGKKIGGVTPKGFGGWLIGYNELLKHGFDPFSDCQSVEYLGTHDKVVRAVMAGRIDVGVIRTGILEKMSGKGEINLADIRVLNQQHRFGFPLLLSSTLYPEWAFAKTFKVSDAIAKKVAIALLEMPVNHRAAQKGHYEQWTIPLTYQPVHLLMQHLRVGSYSEYGKVGILEFVGQHIYKIIVLFWLLLVVIFFVVKFIFLKKSAQDLANEQEKLLVTLRSIGDGVITTDLNSRIMLINKVTEKLTGWSQKEAVGRPIEDVFNIIDEKSGSPRVSPVQEVLATGLTVGLGRHTALIGKDGRRYKIEDSGAPIFDRYSKIIGTVLVFRDVTDKKRIDEELVKVKKLESVGVLAGGLAHDFNNILAAILGNIELAEMQLDPASEAASLLTEASRASIRAKDLTQQLLTFAKGGDPVKQTSSIGKIIRDSADFVLHGSSVVCQYNIPDDLWHCEVDAGQISQVIQNIIINGRHAMPEGGVIEVSCENVIDAQAEGLRLPAEQNVKITIADSGVGIPAQYIEKIFDPYFSTKQEGSGLGLAICHSIIMKHGGNIVVQSSPGKGTVFSLYLPASLDVARALSPEQPVVVSAKGPMTTIMVMDDDLMIRDMTQQMLLRLGYECVMVADGRSALELYREDFNNDRHIGLVIMDLTIPGGMGGQEAVLKILKINPEAIVVVASGYSNDPVMAHFEKYGFKAAIGKPFQLAELDRLVKAMLWHPGGA